MEEWKREVSNTCKMSHKIQNYASGTPTYRASSFISTDRYRHRFSSNKYEYLFTVAYTCSQTRKNWNKTISTHTWFNVKLSLPGADSFIQAANATVKSKLYT